MRGVERAVKEQSGAQDGPATLPVAWSPQPHLVPVLALLLAARF